ncbi:alpha/beta hydrolase family protein [Nitrospinota bacterium]
MSRRRRILESGGTVSAGAVWQVSWVMGCPDIDSALEKARAFTLEGVAEKIRMPILIVHSVEDGLVPLEMAERLYDECSSADKELKVFRVEDGGSQHCLFDNTLLVSNYIADWWVDRLRSRG